MLYGSKNWSVKGKDAIRIERNNAVMVKDGCGTLRLKIGFLPRNM